MFLLAAGYTATSKLPAISNANETPSVVAVADDSSKAAVNADGNFTFDLPIVVPPGINGQEPKLDIHYSSGAVNGALGVGVQLAGLSAITRCSEIPAIDGLRGTVSFNANDRYCLDGKRLINITGAYGQPGTVYRTERESWELVVSGAKMCGSGPCSFTVTSRDGRSRSYGTTNDSQAFAGRGPDVRSWIIASSTDLNGNVISYVYAGGSSGNPNISRITYGSNPSAGVSTPNRSVQFVYFNGIRPDTITNYVGGFSYAQSTYLTNIQTFLGAALVSNYSLSYKQSVATGRMLLTQVQRCSPTRCATPTVLSWQGQEPPTFKPEQLSFSTSQAGTIQPLILDLNGDGIGDIASVSRDATYTYVSPAVSNGSGTFAVCPSSLNIGNQPHGRLLGGDFNADGIADFVYTYDEGGLFGFDLYFGTASGCRFKAGQSTTVAAAAKPDFVWTADVNGDGKTDLVAAWQQSTGFNVAVMLSNGSTLANPVFSNLSMNVLRSRLYLADVNGDGMMDLVAIYPVANNTLEVAVALSNGSGFNSPITTDFPGVLTINLLGVWPVDLNHDGMTDLVMARIGANQTLLLQPLFSIGNGAFIAGTQTQTNSPTANLLYLSPVDTTGTGTPQILEIYGQGQIAAGTVFTPIGGVFDVGKSFTTEFSASTKYSVLAADYRGTGRAGLIQLTSGNGVASLSGLNNASNQADLLSSITNGLGGRSSVSYAPLSSTSVYRAGSPSPASLSTNVLSYGYRMNPTTWPFQKVGGGVRAVVAQFTQTNVPSFNSSTYSYTSTYAYSNGLVDLSGRGWLGFQSVTQTQTNLGRVTVTAYNQTFPLTGTPASVSIYCNSSMTSDKSCRGGDVLLNQTENSFVGKIVATGAGPQATPVFAVELQQVQIHAFNYGTPDFTRKRQYDFDAYGNQRFIAEFGIDGADRAVYTCIDYVNSVGPTGWVLGNLAYRKVSSSKSCDNYQTFSDSTDFHLEKFSYDSRFNQSEYGIYDNINKTFLKTKYGYDGFGNRTSETLPGPGTAERTTLTSFEGTYHTYPAGLTLPPNASGVTAVTLYGYDPRFGAQVARRSPAGRVFISCVDDLGYVTTVQGPVPPAPANVVSSPSCLSTSTGVQPVFAGANVVTTATLSRAVDGAGRLYTQSRSLDAWPTNGSPVFRWKNAYLDGLGREYMVVTQSDQNPAGIVVCTTLDADGHSRQTSIPDRFSQQTCNSSGGTGFLWATESYDAYRRPLVISTPMDAAGAKFSSTTYQYSSNLVATITRGGNDDTIQTIVTAGYFGGERKITSLSVPATGKTPTIFKYDLTGQLTAILEPPTIDNPKGIQTTITFDSVSRRISIDNPDQNTTGNPSIAAERLRFGTDGLLESLTDAKNQVTRFTYDQRGRVLTRATPDSTVFYGYDDPAADGIDLLTSVKVMSGAATVYSESYAYDAYANRSVDTVNLAVAGQSFSAGKVFDPQRRVISETYPSGSKVTRSYSGGNLLNVSLDGNDVASFSSYTPLGEAQTIHYGNGAIANYTYLAVGLPSTEQLNDRDGKPLLNNTLTWDGLLNLRNINDQLKPGGKDYSETFSYAVGRLASASAPGLYGDESYGYTSDGNRTQLNSMVMSYQAHRIVSGTVGGARVLTLAYDANGNVTSRADANGTVGFSYDSQNRLIQATVSGAAILQNSAFSDTGRRLAKRNPDGSQVFYPLPNYELTRSPGVSDLVTVYVTDGSHPIAAVSSGGSVGTKSTRYIYSNQVHSTTITLDEKGSQSSRFVYLPFGALSTSSSGPNDVRPKFQGKELDTTTRLYYFGSRFYDATLGRFISADGNLASDLFRPDTINRYALALNNPVTLIDTTGRNIWDSIAGSLIGVAEISAGIAIDILSDGALEPLGQGLIGGGIAAIQYSVTSSNDFSWREFGDQEAIGFAIGAVTAGFGEIGAETEAAATTTEETATEATARVGAEFEAEATGEIGTTSVAQTEVGVQPPVTESANPTSVEIGDGAQDSCSLASFVAGTLVWTGRGTTPIEKLREGDAIVSRNAIDHIDRVQPITASFQRQASDLVSLTIEGSAGKERLILTSLHPVAKQNGDWIVAESLTTGTWLQSIDRAGAYVVSVEKLTAAVPVAVFNLALAPDHSYFVGANGIWAHNPCYVIHRGGTSPGRWQYDIELRVPRSEYPESADHITAAQRAGHDDVLTIDRAGAKANRRASLRGWKTQRGYDRDEYPPAMFDEGGAGAHIEYINPSDNRASGSSFGFALRQFGDTTRVWFHVVP